MTLWQSFLLLFAGAFASAQRASEDGACAPASVGVCIENGYPNPGVNVDDDCCAASSGASCAEGYEYTRGGVCNRWDGRKAYDTCCTPCLAGEDCDRGPGYTCAPPWRGVGSTSTAPNNLARHRQLLRLRLPVLLPLPRFVLRIVPQHPLVGGTF